MAQQIARPLQPLPERLGTDAADHRRFRRPQPLDANKQENLATRNRQTGERRLETTFELAARRLFERRLTRAGRP